MKEASKPKILLVDDAESYRDALRLALGEARAEVELVWAADGQSGIQAYLKDTHGFAAVVLDYSLPDMTGTEVARYIRKINPDQTFLFASGHREPDFLIDLLETGGARSFIAKSDDPTAAVARILEAVRFHQQNFQLLTPDNYVPAKAEQEIRSEGLLGRSKAMLEVVQQIRKFRDKPYPALLIGATGTGKEYVARALVSAGKRIVEVHCGRFVESEQMLESELFGHVKGAFTGATNDRTGVLVQAHGQALFLDELHTLPMGAQQKLLRFLETGRFRKMGADATTPETSVNVRIISAVQPDITDRIARGDFLPDLLGRLGDLRINVPSLSDRPEDIEPIVRHFQDEFNAGLAASERKLFRISTLNKMARHRWPLNIRDLRGAVRTLMALTPGEIINPKDFDAYLQTRSGGKARPIARKSLRSDTEGLEIDRIVEALTASESVLDASYRLGLSRWALTRKMSRLKIHPETYLTGSTPGKESNNAR